MAEVRKYFCATDNVTGSKIIGGIQIALNISFVVNFVLAVQAAQAARPEDHSGHIQIAFILILIAYGLGLLVSILLVAGAAKGNAAMIKAYLILNSIVILVILVGRIFGFSGWLKIGGGGALNSFVKPFQGTIGLGMAIWAEVVAFGAHQEIKMQ